MERLGREQSEVVTRADANRYRQYTEAIRETPGFNSWFTSPDYARFQIYIAAPLQMRHRALPDWPAIAELTRLTGRTL
jgi:hypothetical protein